jgi:hypothetical protein
LSFAPYPADPTHTVHNSTASEAYLWLQGANLSFLAGPMDTAWIVPRIDWSVGALSFHSETGSMELHDATGTSSLDGQTKSVSGEQVRLSGALDGSMKRVGNVFAFSLDSPLSESPGVESSTIRNATPGWLAIALAPIAMAGVIVVGARRKSSLDGIQLALADGDFGLTVRRAARVRGANANEAALAKAVALTRLSRYAEAEATLGGAGREAWVGIDAGLRSYLLATIKVRTGHRREARRHVTACLKASPELMAEVVADPQLRELLHPDARGYA